MGRSPCCDENGLKKGPWTPEEDERLLQHIQKNGHGSWRTLPKLAGLNRCGKSCRLRWTNYLRPDIKRGKFSPEEEQTILHLHSVLGNKWSAIATHLPGRTDNEIKNFWNTHLKKRLIQMGFDPMTHRPRTDFFAALPQLLALANLRGLVNAASASTAQPLAEAAQAAKLQCLLQSAATIASISNTADTTLNTMSTPDVTSMYTTSTVQQMPCTLPEAPMAMSYGTELGCQGESSSSTAARAPVLPDSSLPPLAYLSGASDLADGFSASSCCGSWPEFFLDDAFATDFV